MLKQFLNSYLGRLTAMALMIGLLHPVALASGDGDSTPKKPASSTPANVSLAEILNRLEQAEQAAEAARVTAAAATSRAAELERRLNEAELELKKVRKQAAQAAAVMATIKPIKPLNNQEGQEGQEGGQDNDTAKNDAQDDDPDAISTEPEVTLAGLNDQVIELKEMVDNHQTRLENQSRVTVETGEGFNVKLHGTLLFNTYYNTAGTDDPPTGLYLLGAGNQTLDNGSNFGATIRQTQLGFSFHAPTIRGWRLSGDLQLDFFGGNPPVYNGRAFSPLRLRIARAKLETKNFVFTVGQDDPIISPLNPTSIAQVGFPALAESGNLWSWTPQAKVAYKLVNKENERFTIEGGILAPYNGQVNTRFQFETRPDAGERGRMPALEARISYQRGDLASAPTNSYLIFDKQPFQVGIGGHYARQLAVPAREVVTGSGIFTPGTTINSVAVAGDFVIPMGEYFTLSGEAFWGRSLGGLGGGIVQGIVFPIYGSKAIGVRSRGGWAQLAFRPKSGVVMNFAYGVDDPYNEDLIGTTFDLTAATSRAGNRTFSGNILYRFRSNFIMSAEYRFLQTTFTDGPNHPFGFKRQNNHINIGFGYLF